MSEIRIVHFQDPQDFLKATKECDDSFMNATIGTVVDNMNEVQAEPRPEPGPRPDRDTKGRVMLGIYREDELIITFTKIVTDYPWVLAVPRVLRKPLDATEISSSLSLLTSFLPTVIEPKVMDSIIGSKELVNAFVEAWLKVLTFSGISAKASESYYDWSCLTYATLATIPPTSPEFAKYSVTLADTEADVEALAHLLIEFSAPLPNIPTMEKAMGTMREAIRRREIWISRVGDEIAGYIRAGRKTRRVVAIRNLFVLPALRRQGIAEAMVRAVTRFYLGAEPLGFVGAPVTGPEGGRREEICLHVVEDGPKRLYKRCGFMFDEDGLDPATGLRGWHETSWRSVDVEES